MTSTAAPEQLKPANLPESTTEADGSAVVRLLSYNIRSMRDDTTALARVIRACAPDVVCVQEAPRFFRWRKHASRLARETDLTYVTGGATASGPMILASLRAHVEHTEDALFPLRPGLHRRGLATAVLRFSRAARVSVVSCHLSLRADERREQAGRLLERLARQEGAPQVVAGDLNERPDGRGFRRLATRLRDGWTTAPWGTEYTSTAENPHQRIDAVLLSEGLELFGCGVPSHLPGVTAADLRAASDHLPVLAAMRVPPEPSSPL